MNTITKCIPARRRHLPFLALLLATVTLLAFAPRSVLASSEKPFHANFITQFTSVLDFPLLHLTVNGKGNATYIGTTTAFTDDQVSNLIDGSGSATYTLTAKNGDTLVLVLVVQPGGTINVEGECFSPAVIQSPEAQADSAAPLAAVFSGEPASFLLRPMASAHLPLSAQSCMGTVLTRQPPAFLGTNDKPVCYQLKALTINKSCRRIPVLRSHCSIRVTKEHA